MVVIEAQQIAEWIEAGLPGSQATVEGDGRHFSAVVICPAFAGLNTIKRHRLVYEALGERMREDIHALSLKTLTPEEQGN